jgi:iron complex outermembrane receptor protein
MLKILFIFILFPFVCFNQVLQKGTIIGFVFDNKTNSPLSDANIVLDGYNGGTTSSKDGKFILANIPFGNYVLKVSFMGYQNYQKNIQIKNTQNIQVNIKLNETLITSNEVNVSANRNVNVFEQSNRINAISIKSIESAPVHNLPELIDYMPGVNLNNTFGIYSSNTVVTLHGLPSNNQSRTLVLLDGMPLNISDEGSVNWNMINKNNIQSVKVIKGPGPAKYGNGAMGGVIELVSKKPVKFIQGDILTEYGTYNTWLASLDLNGTTKDSISKNSFYWGLSGFGRKSDGYITELKQFRTIADSILVPAYLKEINMSAKAGYTIRKNNNIEVQFNCFDDTRGNGVKVFEDMGAYSTHRTFSEIVKYSGKTDLFHWNATVFNLFEHYIRQYEYMKEGEYQLYGADSKRNDMGYGVDFTSDKFLQSEITAGFNYKLGSVDGTDTYYTSTDIIRNTGKMQTSAVFLQDEIKLLNEKLTVNLGVRYDFAHFYNGLFTIDYPSYSIEFYKNFENTAVPSKYWNAFCPRFNAQYLFSKSDRIYTSIAKGFRAPILDDMTRTGKKKQGFSVANPNLKPELITTYELGGDKSITKNLLISCSVYYSIGHNFMYYVSNGDTVNMGYKLAPVLTMQNINQVKIYGAETELKYDLKENLSLFMNYSYTHAQITRNQINNAKVDSNLAGKQLTDVPNHKISAGFTWRNKIVNTTILFKYIGKTWINDLNVIDENYLNIDRYPEYTTINIKLERKIIKGLMVGFSIENLFNKIYVTSDAQTCPGRLITGSVRYNF